MTTDTINPKALEMFNHLQNAMDSLSAADTVAKTHNKDIPAYFNNCPEFLLSQWDIEAVNRLVLSIQERIRKLIQEPKNEI
jgi:hypothetical protein